MRKTLLSLSTIAMLSGCAYATDTAVQDITIHTPGAEDAVCMLYVDKVKYRVHPPQTTSIFNTKEDLRVDCLAPGNRRKEVIIPPTISDKAIGNIATAGVGYAWDYASGALYNYPELVEVSFIGIPIGPAFVPAQNNPDIRQPEDYRLEEFKPSQPRLNSDRDNSDVSLTRRGGTIQRTATYPAESFSENSSMTGGKGSLQDAVESYGGAINPSAGSAPTPLIPGE